MRNLQISAIYDTNGHLYHRQDRSNISKLFVFSIFFYFYSVDVALVVAKPPISQIKKIKGSNIVSDKVVSQLLGDHLYL